VDQEVTGDQPDLGGDMRVMVEFQAAITCKHGHTIAPTCARGCRRATWLDAVVRPRNETEPPRTVRDVVEEFIAAKKISGVEVVERFVKGEVRRERRKRYTKVAALSGISVTAALLVYKGGKLFYRLWAERRADREQKKA
jgi:hypothetical protein